MCVITGSFIDKCKNYQICGCGKHIWSHKANKFLKPFRGEFMLYVDKERKKYVLHEKCDNVVAQYMLTIALIIAICIYGIVTTNALK